MRHGAVTGRCERKAARKIGIEGVEKEPLLNSPKLCRLSQVALTHPTRDAMNVQKGTHE